MPPHGYLASCGYGGHAKEQLTTPDVGFRNYFSYLIYYTPIMGNWGTSTVTRWSVSSRVSAYSALRPGGPVAIGIGSWVHTSETDH